MSGRDATGKGTFATPAPPTPPTVVHRCVSRSQEDGMASNAGSCCSDDSLAQSLGVDITQEGDRERIARLEVAVAWIKQEMVSRSHNSRTHFMTESGDSDSRLVKINLPNCIILANS